MSFRISYTRFVFSFIVLFDAMTIFLATFVPNLENKLYLVMLICLYIFYLKKIALKNLKSFIVVHTLLVVYIGWTIINQGMYFVFHLDFYAFVGFALTLLIFSRYEILEALNEYLYKNANLVILSNVMFFLILAMSIPLRGGLHTGFNMGIPILYGPYSIPHDVAYECLFLYCLNGVMYKRIRQTKFLIFKWLCLVCIVWTATRSAFVAMAILVFIDYCAYRNKKKKYLLFMVAIIGVMYLGLFTDFLISNPITQKTIAALRDTGTISNSRGYFAKSALNGYIKNTNTVQKLLGMGIEGVRTTLKSDPLIKVPIHAHNDYINILCGYGIIGFIILIIQQCRLMPIWNKLKYSLIAESFLFILLYTNGLAMYCIVHPLIPILFIFIDECCNSRLRGALDEKK